jgi:GTP:adenosylcobinamide-phosphate guanylyltransferase
LNAVITAGARVSGEFARRTGTDVKALARIGNRSMLEATIEAARGAGVTRIAVVGGAEVRAACGDSVDRAIDEADDGESNIRRALSAWDPGAPLLYLTSDMPFINAQALRAFLQAVPSDALALALTDCADFERRFAGAPAFGIDLAGERVVNGGAFWIPPNAAARIETFAVRFFSARKSAARMAALVGPVFCLRFMLRRLSIEALERHAQHLLGIPARAIRGASPDLAYDVDTLEEYVYAAEHA